MKPNKTEDWLDDALDAVPTAVPPADFRARVDARLRREGLRHVAFGGRVLRLLRPVAVAAAAALLLAVGYHFGAGGGTVAEIRIDPGGQLAASELTELYDARELLTNTWELSSDADLDAAFRALDAEDAEWLDQLLAEAAADEAAPLPAADEEGGDGN